MHLRCGAIAACSEFHGWPSVKWNGLAMNQYIYLEFLVNVKCRKLEYLGRIMQNEKYHLLQLILQGKIGEWRTAGCRRIWWLRNLRAWTGLMSAVLVRNAVNKVIWSNGQHPQRISTCRRRRSTKNLCGSNYSRDENSSPESLSSCNTRSCFKNWG